MNADDVIALLKEAKVEEALGAADKVEDKREMAEKLTEFAGTLNYLKGHDIIAEVLLKKSLLLYYDYAPTHYNLGVLYTNIPKLIEDEGNTERAELAYKNALEIDPHFHEARYNLAMLYYMTGRVEEARREYDRILEGVGDTIRYRELGMLLMKDGG